MPDITMCQDWACPRCMDCYRYRAVPNRYQSYFMWSPLDGDKCGHFAQIREGDRLSDPDEE